MRPNFNIEPLHRSHPFNIYHIRIFIPKVVTSTTYTRNILTENDEERERDSKHRLTSLHPCLESVSKSRDTFPPTWDGEYVEQVVPHQQLHLLPLLGALTLLVGDLNQKGLIGNVNVHKMLSTPSIVPFLGNFDKKIYCYLGWIQFCWKIVSAMSITLC